MYVHIWAFLKEISRNLVFVGTRVGNGNFQVILYEAKNERLLRSESILELANWNGKTDNCNNDGVGENKCITHQESTIKSRCC